jgi:hypothetical protein
MKRFIPLALALFIFTMHALAQSRQTIRIKPGADAKESLLKELYRYPQFLSGKAYFSNGDVSGANMNYNYLNESMEFIDERGDTLAIADAAAVVYVSIGSDTFFYDKGFLEKKAGNGKTTVAVKQKLSLADVQKIGALGIPSGTTNIESKESYTDKRYMLSINEELVFSKQATYYIRKEAGPFMAATKKNLLKLYPEQKRSIETFYASSNTAVSDEDKTTRLVRFLSML